MSPSTTPLPSSTYSTTLSRASTSFTIMDGLEDVTTEPDWAWTESDGIGGAVLQGFTAIILLLGICALCLNLVLIFYYKKKVKETIPMMYMLLAICDGITGALTFLHALVLPKFLPHFFIGLCYVITTTSMRASLFNNMVLAAIRTINIKIPFYRIKKRLVVAVVVMCPVFWAVLSIWEFIACKEGGAKGWPIIFFLIIQNPGFDLIHSDSFGWLKEYANYIDNIVSMWLPFVLPCIILLVCATIQSYTLLMYKKPTEVKERKRLSRRKA